MAPAGAAPSAALAGWAEAERGRFAPWLAVGLIAGAVCYFSLRTEPWAWSGALALALAVGALAAGWRHGLARGAAAMALAAALGFAAGQVETALALPDEPVPRTAVVLSAVVRGVDVLPEGRRLVLEQVRTALDRPPLRRLVRVRMKRGDGQEVAAGDRIAVRALLRAPQPPAYPGAWDQQREAWFAGVAAGGTALDPVRVVAHDGEGGVAAWLQGVRDAVGARAMDAIGGTEGAVAATLLTGSTRAIPEDDRAAFRDSGLAHLLAVAGLHIGTVMGLVMLLSRFGLAAWPHAALHWPTKPIAAALALAAGAAYAVLTGLHVPTLRSLAMAALVTLAILCGRRAVSMRALALAATVLVLLAPHEVMGVSFQMSFGAVAALIAGYEALRPALAVLRRRRVLAHAAALVLTSLLAGTASAPFAAYHFGHVQIWSVAANVVAVPITAFLVLPLGLLALALMPFGLDQPAFDAMGWGLARVVDVARAVASWPEAARWVPPMPAWGLGLLALGLATLCLWRTRVRLAGLGLILAGVGSAWVVAPPDLVISSDGRLIALRGADGAYMAQALPGLSSFVRDAVQTHLSGVPFRPLGPPVCDATTCRAGPLLVLRNRVFRAGCVGVGLVVSAEPARGVCPAAGLLDRFSVWRDGAHAVWIGREGRISVLSDRAHRGQRPWVPGLPVPRARVPGLPMAPVDPLPPWF